MIYGYDMGTAKMLDKKKVLLAGAGCGCAFTSVAMIGSAVCLALVGLLVFGYFAIRDDGRKATNQFLEIELSRNVQILEYTDDHGPPIMEAADGSTFCRLKLNDTDHRYLTDHAKRFPNWYTLPIPPEYRDQLPSKFEGGVPLSNTAGFFYTTKAARANTSECTILRQEYFTCSTSAGER